MTSAVIALVAARRGWNTGNRSLHPGKQRQQQPPSLLLDQEFLLTVSGNTFITNDLESASNPLGHMILIPLTAQK
jgi:hypothetical protein